MSNSNREHSGVECRLCGTHSSLTINIFENEDAELDLKAKIVRHLPLQLAEDDGFSRYVCYPCADILDSWDQFFKFCIERDNDLRSIQAMKETETSKEQAAKIEVIEVEAYANGDNFDDNFSEEDDEPLIVVKSEMKREIKLNPRRRKGVPKRFLREDSKTACSRCGKEFKNKNYVLKHEERCGRKKLYTCSICGNIYKSNANLDKHMDREHNTDQELCPVCQMPIARKKMSSHLKMEHSIKLGEDKEKFKCKYCAEWFSNKYTRNEHVKKVHTLQECIKCDSCDFEGLRHIVKRHIRSVHSEKRYPCALCSNAFKTMHMLKMHMTSHSDMRCYTCDICGMGFKRLNNVRDHMKCHQQKSNQCQICGNFFARKRYLAVHEQTIHNFYADGVEPEEKGFECGTCGAKLKWKKNLLAHMRIHTGEKPYDCKICHRGFVCHGSLRAHLVKHSVANESVLLAPDDPMSLEMSVLTHFSQSLQQMTHPT